MIWFNGFLRTQRWTNHPNITSCNPKKLQVCNGWRSIAVRLGLNEYVQSISHSKEKCKLRILFNVWRQEKYETYTVETLKLVLSQEVVFNHIYFYYLLSQGFTDMYRWICLMTTKTSPGTNPARQSSSPSPFRRNQFGTKSLSIPRPQHRPIRSSPMSDYLYSQTPTYNDSSSPYSEYFGNSTQNKIGRTNMTKTTNISAQTSTGFIILKFIVIFISKYLGSDYSSYSPTSPGSISSTFRHNSSLSRTMENGGASTSVFNVLYKPDLIKLSSPLILRRRYQDDDVVNGGKRNPITITREEMTTRWVKEASSTK